MQSESVLPLIPEAALLLLFGLMGTALGQYRVVFVPATVALLYFLVRLRNAIITKISKAEIRTMHTTGLATDTSVEIGKALYWNHGHHNPPAVMVNQPRLRLLASLPGMFPVGGVVDALGFRHLGYAATIPLASILMLLVVVPVVDDLLARHRQRTDAAQQLVARHTPHSDHSTVRTTCMRSAEHLASWRVK